MTQTKGVALIGGSNGDLKIVLPPKLFQGQSIFLNGMT